MSTYPSAAFKVGDLVRFRRYDRDPAVWDSGSIPIWSSPAEFSSAECSWIPCSAVGVVIETNGVAFRICASSGHVGWADTWDLELV